MKRALRLDKIRLAALEAVLKLYRDPDRLPETLPALRAFVRPQSDLTASAARLRDAIASAVGSAYSVRIAECMSQIGSGSLPLETLPSAGLAIAPVERKGAGGRLDLLASAFRGLPIPVIGRVRDGELILDLRCLDDEAGFLGVFINCNLTRVQGQPGRPAHDRRYRGPYRSRQNLPGLEANGHRYRPPQGGESPRNFHRPWFRLLATPRWLDCGLRGRARPRGARAQYAGWRHGHRFRDPRCRRR